MNPIASRPLDQTKPESTEKPMNVQAFIPEAPAIDGTTTDTPGTNFPRTRAMPPRRSMRSSLRPTHEVLERETRQSSPMTRWPQVRPAAYHAESPNRLATADAANTA